MSTRASLMALAVAGFMTAAPAFAEREKHIALSEVPEAVMAAAQKALPGITFSEAEVTETGEGLVYELEGTADGKEHEINISADGTILGRGEDDDD